MSQFRNLVFEGGGVKGIAYAGALEVLDGEGILKDIRRVAGTSAGAITAALVALGVGAKDVGDIVAGTSFRSFMDDSWGFIRDTKRLLADYGWYKGDAFAAWMKKLVYRFADDANLTFAGLRQLAEKHPDRYRDLHIVGTNLSMQAEKVFSAERTPDIPVWLATRISMSIPLFFAAVACSDGMFVDGGVTWNYPIDLFDNKRYVSRPEAMRVPEHTVYDEYHVYNKESLGFRLATRDIIKAEKEDLAKSPVEIENIVSYLSVLMGYVLEMANSAHLHKDDWARTIF